GELSNGAFHIETIMYGRDGSCDNPGAPSEGRPAELPGWAEEDSNSVLINGRPIARGMQTLQTNIEATGVSVGGHVLSFVPGTPASARTVRVTGVVSLDCGHANEPCGSGPGGAGLELHPVYAIDLVEPPGPDLSGAWDDGREKTFYIRVLGSQVAVLGMGPFRDASFGMVGIGTLSGNVIDLTWADVPLGTDSLWDLHTHVNVAAGNGVLEFTDGPRIRRTLTKLYGACPTDTYCHDAGLQCGNVQAPCGASVFCGDCPGGYMCIGGRCAAPPPPDCQADPLACTSRCPEGSMQCECNGTRSCARVCPKCIRREQ
ncbi:MAG: hypothetical protein ACRDYC_03520, partial [Acidimicrobiales bacterium]